jgi:phage shock protein PspC (stress-responsive transcriptional regulator)
MRSFNVSLTMLKVLVVASHLTTGCLAALNTHILQHLFLPKSLLMVNLVALWYINKGYLHLQQ